MTGFQLKILACVFMVIDHTALFFPPAIAFPMHWIGRMAAPIFFFQCGQSCAHTHDLKRYVARLYGASVVMVGFEFLLNRNSNIFATLFQTALMIWILSLPKLRSRLLGIGVYAIWQIATSLLLLVVVQPLLGVVGVLPIAALLGNFVVIEGGYYWVLIGVVLWLFHSNKRNLAISFIALDIVYVLLDYANFYLADHGGNGVVGFVLGTVLGLGNMGGGIWNPLTVNYQWMMIAALLFMLLYNGKRGRPVKWFFYIFYPAHLAVIKLLMMIFHVSFGA